MTEITLSLRINRETGKKDIVIKYESDSDALPLEHDQAHKAVVERLLDAGVLKAEDVGNVVVERTGLEAPPETEKGNNQRVKPIISKGISH